MLNKVWFPKVRILSKESFFLKFVSLLWDISRLNDNALLIEEFKASCVIIVVSTFAVGQSSVIGLFSL